MEDRVVVPTNLCRCPNNLHDGRLRDLHRQKPIVGQLERLMGQHLPVDTKFSTCQEFAL